jgi:hypothetical protein
VKRAQFVLALLISGLALALLGALIAGAVGLVHVLSIVVLVSSVALLATLLPAITRPRRPT